MCVIYKFVLCSVVLIWLKDYHPFIPWWSSFYRQKYIFHDSFALKFYLKVLLVQNQSLLLDVSHTSCLVKRGLAWIILLFFFHRSSSNLLQCESRFLESVTAFCARLLAERSHSPAVARVARAARREGGKQSQPDICWLRGDDSAKLSPQTAAAVRCMEL